MCFISVFTLAAVVVVVAVVGMLIPFGRSADASACGDSVATVAAVGRR